MTCSTQFLPAAAEPASWAQWALGAIKGQWNAYWRYRHQRATVFLLHSLCDRALEDIGLHRTEIESVVYGRPGERTVHYQSPR
jgi:uncharacterized protein YjiS (DUF1127 family)